MQGTKISPRRESAKGDLLPNIPGFSPKIITTVDYLWNFKYNELLTLSSRPVLNNYTVNSKFTAFSEFEPRSLHAHGCWVEIKRAAIEEEQAMKQLHTSRVACASSMQ